MKKLVIITAITSTLLTGCKTTPHIPVATGGSKADGTVLMTYEFGIFDTNKVDLSRSDEQATRRCKAWGYEKAESFDSGMQRCLAFNGYGNCTRTQVTITYQCIGERG